jgi:predicted metalloprotease with PDZ domain
MTYKISILCFTLCLGIVSSTQAQTPKMAFKVTMENPSSHLYHVTLKYSHTKKEDLDFKMCTWTPGFYEIVDFAAAVKDFKATSADGHPLTWAKDSSTWKVHTENNKDVIINYDVKAVEPFIGNVNLDENYGYIIPGGLFMYLESELRHPVTIEIQPYSGWDKLVATGLDTIPGKSNVFYAADFDILYDSPFLMGKLEVFPSFTVKGIPHQFIGYNLGEFDRNLFMADLQKIVEQTSNFIGDIPYSHYTFLAVGHKGSGSGGIEHLNSSSLLIGNNNLLTPGYKEHFYTFLSHEYFHLYNVKRIRPIELGPFDYSKENYTTLLWVSEGITDYYAYLGVRAAGLGNDEYVLKSMEEHIKNYENIPGHLYQSAAAASKGIWAIRGNPFTRTDKERDSTISVYDKGCILGLMIDFKIRYETNNKHSLDDVMKNLYKKYYQERKRGFTDLEFQKECELVASVPLKEVFSYANTVTPVNYPKYFAYAGLHIDTVTHLAPPDDVTKKSFRITPMQHPTALQQAIYTSWLNR